MGGDYTRFTFDPSKDYSTVLKQQGRVSLDADANELAEIQDRRWRAETIDIIGRAVVPKETPDGFKIQITGGTFTIGHGRMYVHGLLAENHGLLDQTEFDNVLGEVRGTKPIPYADQPYYPKPLPAITQGNISTRTDLVYLDVWQREVTAIEDPEIREIALGGPDTSTRLQTVWQVKILEDVSAKSCADQISKWDKLVAPSAGRLTASAVAPPESDASCVISLTGGYRGLENRLYRIEIHRDGVVGGSDPTKRAKFKWSRDNGSVVAAVDTISSQGTELTVKTLGRDQVLRFQVGDWVEILDDHTEFKGDAGPMAKVTKIDEANRILTISSTISTYSMFDPSNAANRHTRVRRWDQKRNVDANGLLDVTAGPIEIEDGVQVSFSADPVGGSCKVGDYWVFAARTAGGSVEPLDKAPPRGIIHHYCRLALITWGNNSPATTTVTDCRKHWPPVSRVCCTEVVYPGEDIQAALNRLPEKEGGCVCLRTGTHEIYTALSITQPNVIICGESLGTRILCKSGGSAVRLEQSATNARVEGILFDCSENESTSETDQVYTIDVTASHCIVRGNSILLSAFQGGIRVSGAAVVHVEKNDIRSSVQAQSDGVNFPCGIKIDETRESIIDNNDISGLHVGVFLQGGAGNRLQRNHVQDGGSGLIVNAESDLEASENTVETMREYGFKGYDLTQTTLVVRNRFVSCGYEGSDSDPSACGIFINVSGDLRIESCEIVNTGIWQQEKTTNLVHGISLWRVKSCQISGNLITYLEPQKLRRQDGWLQEEHRALVLHSADSADSADSTDSVQVLNNKFLGPGKTHLVECHFGPNGKVMFNNNHCEHIGGNELERGNESGRDNPATVLFARRGQGQNRDQEGQLIVMGNHVKGEQGMPSMNFNNLQRVAVMGNVVSGRFIPIPLSSNVYIPSPADHFNVIG